MDWIFEDNKKCVVIGSMNAIAYKNIFPLIKESKLWLGRGFSSGNSYFMIQDMFKGKGMLVAHLMRIVD